ncbi:MAG: sulfite exporter TauE/SafE family protein, partial [Rhodospirillales bacterium]|nr:sulfite exporter TauE/SafE family protein [Rhodospirillales bacterium]
PLTAAALPPERAIGVLLPILIVADVFSVYHHRKHQSWRHLHWLWLGMVFGIAVCTAVLWWFASMESSAPTAEAARELSASPLAIALNLTVGLLCLFFVLMQVYRMIGGHVPHIPEGPSGAIGSGAFAATVSTIAHAAGPVISIYLLEQRMSKQKLVGTMILFFFVLNLSKLPSYLALSLITPVTLTESLCFVLFVPIGTLLGVWMHHRIAEKPFNAVMYIGAALAATNMLYNAWPSVADWTGL